MITTRTITTTDTTAVTGSGTGGSVTTNGTGTTKGEALFGMLAILYAKVASIHHANIAVAAEQHLLHREHVGQPW